MSSQNPIHKLSSRERYAIVIMCFVNIVNYMDRYGVAGILVSIQEDYDIGDDLAGLLQTGFIFSYMLCSPIFGYLGDRYSRKVLLILCIAGWSAMTFCGSLAPNYEVFFISRMLVGVGEAGYSVIAPTVISDIVSQETRTVVLALFYLAIPMGSGFGYIVSAKISQWSGYWRWGLRATPFLGITGAFLMFFAVNPERGEKEAAALGGTPPKTTAYKEDLNDLKKNASFVLSTGAFTCVSFISGALGWWAPKCLYFGFKLIKYQEDIELGDVVFKFGAITAFTGLLGVIFGSLLSRLIRPHIPWIDPIICGLGLFISLPLLALALYACSHTILETFILVFFAQIFLNLNWAVVADILLYVVIPTRRATAEAMQMLISHALGDSCSPYIVGIISEGFKSQWDSSDAQNNSTNGVNNDENEFYSLQSSLYSIMLVLLAGAVFFFWTAVYVVEDRKKVDVLTAQ